MDSRAIVFALLVLVTPILAIWNLREHNKANPPNGGRRWLSFCTLALWASLILFLTLNVIWKNHWVRVGVYLADAFLLLSILLLVITAAANVGRWKLLCASVALVVLWVGTEQYCAFVGQGSGISVLVSMIGDKTRLNQPESYYAVLHRMSQYRRRGFYRPAIALGEAWTERHQSVPNEDVFISMAGACLEKARHDQGQADIYVEKAVEYRDHALRAATSDVPIGMKQVHDLAAISEIAGDLSQKQRCVQYGNAIKLHNYFVARLDEKRDEISRRFVPEKDDLTISDVDCLKAQSQTEINRLRDKRQRSGCQ
jgi:hypothetical protein